MASPGQYRRAEAEELYKTVARGRCSRRCGKECSRRMEQRRSRVRRGGEGGGGGGADGSNQSFTHRGPGINKIIEHI